MSDDYPNALPHPTTSPDSAPLRRIDLNEEWLPYMLGAIASLNDARVWEGLTMDDDTLRNVETLLAIIINAPYI